MNSTILAVVTMAAASIPGTSESAVADPVIGAFARMLAHEPIPLAPAMIPRGVGNGGGFQFEQWVNRVARGETSGPERGFASMAERVAYVPAALTVQGEPDEVDRLVADVLRPEALCGLRLVAR